jgi:hypothetical protein
MWVPKTEEEIINAVTGGFVEESPIFDAKKDLPQKNQEIAKDIAAMATDGGVLIYGIDEDVNGRPTILNPIPLANQPERITSIVQTSIAEPPFVSITTVPTISNQSIGYIIVVVPASERAPHMVIVKGEHRYYGRTAKGNRILNEAEVARLYERRKLLEVDRDKMIEEEIKQSPVPNNPDSAYLYLIVRPVFRSDDILSKVKPSGDIWERVLNDLILSVTKPEVYPTGIYSPDFGITGKWTKRTEGFLGKLRGDGISEPTKILNLQIDFDGSGHLFCGRAADRNEDTLLFFPSLVAGNTKRFLVLFGMIYEKTQYVGLVDVGLALTGLLTSVPHVTRSLSRFTPYDRDEYRRTKRISAQMLQNDSTNVTKQLLMPLIDAMSQGQIDPFK